MTENTETAIDLDDVLQCLRLYSLECKPGYDNNREEMLEMRLEYAETDAEVAEMRAQFQRGAQYYAAGYRIHQTQRFLRGLGAAEPVAPDSALAHLYINAGHIATSEALRLLWITEAGFKHVE